MEHVNPESNLEPHEEAETMAGPPSSADGDTASAPTPLTSTPEQIGHYRVKRLIAEGGMGSVFEAIQEQPRRTVALKIMKAGIASRSALRRFAYESQILGRLRHPGIAQVYEAGTHDDGSGGVPYFAMEYVPGARVLTEYVQSKELSTNERLELFLKVCDAVHHGHQKGIIHRDLKPQNILVDSTGQPKIIDFGIARATDSDLAVATLQTQVGELVGTVQYMSPEQCEADPHDLDIRSDVYALGMVLYEVLCGRLPYDVTSVGLIEATRVIRETRPTPLSPTNSELKGDVETITFKALEKERDRRYQSAAELASDIRRYLGNQPILARPPSLVYQARLFARRHTALVAGASAGVIALAIGLVGTTLAMVRAQRAEAKAVREGAIANESLGFIVDSLERLDPRLRAGELSGADVKVADLFELWSGQLNERFTDMPEVRLRLRTLIGRGYRELSMYGPAFEELKQVMELQRSDPATDPDQLALTVRDVGAVRWWQGRLERDKALFGESEEYFRESLAMLRELHEPPHEEIANGLNYLAAALDFQDRYDEAEPIYREALAMREALALSALDEGRRDAQERVARGKNNLATCLRRQGKYAEAERCFREAIAIVRDLHGSNHIDIGNGSANLAGCLRRQGQPEKLQEAVGLYRDSIRIKRMLQGDDHTQVAETEHHFAELLLDLEQFSEAEERADEALQIWLSRLGPEHWRIAAANSVIGAARAGEGRYEEAEALLTACLERFQSAEENLAIEIRETLERLVALYERWERPEDARRYREMLTAAQS
ncbi:MAG: serine/threonine-protein kinase [Planctomycetota bacterium]|jgi:non-specific serine/threonine protein kinase/serine/threonine-protein kinase